MKNSENIDKIFSKGLHTYERQPRPEAWGKLEARLQKPKSKVLPIWWKYASAASVALLLGIGGYWFSNQKINSEEQVTVNKKPVIEKIISTENPIELSGKLSDNSRHPNIRYGQDASNWTAQKKCNLRPEIIVDKERKFVEEKIEYPSENQEIKQIAKIPTIESKENEEQNTIVLVLENTKPKVEEETIVLNMVETKPEVVAQTDSNDGITKKETRISKIWQQLKRAKNGENVNWSEVGIKPQKMLARADAKIENVLTKGESNEK
jgi:hypothetical protein